MCADQLNLRDEIINLEKSGIDGFHIDIMDNHFVPNLALSLDTLNLIRKLTKLTIDVHLMIEYPETVIRKLVDMKISNSNQNTLFGEVQKKSKAA